MTRRREVHDVVVEVLADRPLSIKAKRADGGIGDPAWFPRSAIEIFENEPVPGVSTLTIPEGLLVEKGWA